LAIRLPPHSIFANTTCFDDGLEVRFTHVLAETILYAGATEQGRLEQLQDEFLDGVASHVDDVGKPISFSHSDHTRFSV
jgi:hypothetical protein